MEIFALISPLALAGALGVGLLAGVVKGAVGFGMPLILIALGSIFVDPKLMVAGLILPVLISNVQQMLQQGLSVAVDAAREFRVYILVMCVVIFVTAQMLAGFPAQVMFLVLGVPVLGLCLIQLFGVRLGIAPAYRGVAAPVMGAVSGAMGGFAGTWGPTTVLYLVALDTPKSKQVVVQGVIFGIGGVPLLAGHLQSGLLNWQTAAFSALMVPPVVLGMTLGLRIQNRIDQATFRKATLIVLSIAAANLIRRGLMG